VKSDLPELLREVPHPPVTGQGRQLDLFLANQGQIGPKVDPKSTQSDRPAGITDPSAPGCLGNRHCTCEQCLNPRDTRTPAQKHRDWLAGE